MNNHDGDALYEDPLYWNGPRGYRAPGYADFALNGVRAAYIDTLLPCPSRILDVGCASGYLCRRLRWRGHDAWGIDISRYALDHAPVAMQPYLRQAPATCLSFPDNSFDFLVSTGVMEHVTAPLEALGEFKRVAPRGLISLAVLGAQTQHEDDGHDNLQPLDWWRAQMPDGYTVMDDDTSMWGDLAPRGQYAACVLIETPFANHEITMLVQAFTDRGYIATSASDAKTVPAKIGDRTVNVHPDIILRYRTEMDRRLLVTRIAAYGIASIVDEAVRLDDQWRARRKISVNG